MLAHDLLTPKPSKVYMTFFFQTNTIEIILINTLALLSFIMAVDGNHQIEAQESVHQSIHHKNSPHGYGRLIKAF